MNTTSQVKKVNSVLQDFLSEDVRDDVRDAMFEKAMEAIAGLETLNLIVQISATELETLPPKVERLFGIMEKENQQTIDQVLELLHFVCDEPGTIEKTLSIEEA